MIAERLQLTERETLQVLLIALRQAIIALNWEIQCRKCTGIDFSPKRLHDLGTKHICPGCHHIHETNADDQVRVTFSIDEGLRQLKRDADVSTFRASIDAGYGVVSGHRLLTLQTYALTLPRLSKHRYARFDSRGILASRGFQ
ncbi:MAG: DUF5939 domain-containing protein [Heteroscytonema crispum UTEX LB 1556]